MKLTQPQRDFLIRIDGCSVHERSLCIPDKRLATRLEKRGWVYRLGGYLMLTRSGVDALVPVGRVVVDADALSKQIGYKPG